MTNFLTNLPKTTAKKHKRLGRGTGSGVGSHTVGRGQKGQKSRGGSLGLMFEGTKNKKSLVQRLPILRGRNKFKPLKIKPIVLTTGELNNLRGQQEVSVDTLVQIGLIKKKEITARGVKILDGGKVTLPLTVKVPTSKAAKTNIENAGGKVISF
jgi:large subunit ribosomal protein L15